MVGPAKVPPASDRVSLWPEVPKSTEPAAALPLPPGRPGRISGPGDDPCSRQAAPAAGAPGEPLADDPPRAWGEAEVRRAALDEAGRVLPGEIGGMLPPERRAEVARMCGEGFEGLEAPLDVLGGRLAELLVDVLWRPLAGCESRLRAGTRGAEDLSIKLQLFWRCAVALCAMPLPQLAALSLRKRPFLHDLDAFLPAADLDPALARLAHVRLNLPIFAMTAQMPAERSPEPAPQPAEAACLPAGPPQGVAGPTSEGLADAEDVVIEEVTADPAAPAVDQGAPLPDAGRSQTAARHVYDTGYKKWEKFDVDEAIREVDGLNKRSEAAALPKPGAAHPAPFGDPLEELGRAIASAGKSDAQPSAGEATEVGPGPECDAGPPPDERAPLSAGDHVEACGLVSDAGRRLNGQRGTVRRHIRQTGRFEVEFASAPGVEGGAICLKRENLRSLGPAAPASDSGPDGPGPPPGGLEDSPAASPPPAAATAGGSTRQSWSSGTSDAPAAAAAAGSDNPGTSDASAAAAAVGSDDPGTGTCDASAAAAAFGSDHPGASAADAPAAAPCMEVGESAQVRLDTGDLVEAFGLKSQMGGQLNGRRGTVMQHVGGRYEVRFEPTSALPKGRMCLRPENLRKVELSVPDSRGAPGTSTAEALTEDYRKWEEYDDDDIEEVDDDLDGDPGHGELDALTGPREEVARIRAHWRTETKRRLRQTRAAAKPAPRAQPSPPSLPAGPVTERPCEYRPAGDPEVAPAQAIQRDYGKWKQYDADAAVLEIDNEGTTQDGNAMRCSASKASAMLAAEGYTKDREEYDLDQDIQQQMGGLKKVLAQRLQDAAQHKAAGNALFRDGRAKQACAEYTHGLECMSLCEQSLVLMSDSLSHKNKQLIGDLRRNLAAAQLAAGDLEGVLGSCGAILDAPADDGGDACDEKALHRRATALLRLHRADEARRDIDRLAAQRGEGDAVVRRLRAEAAKAPAGPAH